MRVIISTSSNTIGALFVVDNLAVDDDTELLTAGTFLLFFLFGGCVCLRFGGFVELMISDLKMVCMTMNEIDMCVVMFENTNKIT